MKEEIKNKIISFLTDQNTQSEHKARGYVFDFNNKKRPTRNIYTKIDKYIVCFLSGNVSVRWLTLTGLRGAGKTTIMSQFFLSKKNEDVYKLYISVDQVVQLLGVSLDDVFKIYEELIGKSFEELDKPLFLFLDEVQYDEKWGITLKSLYDRSNKIFIFATGSAALAMNTNPDIARRTILEKLFPLNFTEYIKIKENIFEKKGLSRKLKQAIFESNSSKVVYEKIYKLKSEIDSYLYKIEKSEFNKYITYGSLPFMVELKNEAIIYDQINKTLDRIINGDVAKTGKFSSDIVSKIPAILYAVADMDQINYSKISNIFEISRPKVMEIFEILEKTETLLRIYPYGSHLNQVKKPSKYLFSSSAFRYMYYNLVGNIISKQNVAGKLYEDIVAMYLSRYIYKKPASSITYDSAEGGADFILKIGDKRIVIEVGVSKKNCKQVLKTAKKVSSQYNLIISSNELEFSEENNTVKIPLTYFLLM